MSAATLEDISRSSVSDCLVSHGGALLAYRVAGYEDGLRWRIVSNGEDGGTLVADGDVARIAVINLGVLVTGTQVAIALRGLVEPPRKMAAAIEQRDPELAALEALARIMGTLAGDDAAIERVIRYAFDRWGDV